MRALKSKFQTPNTLNHPPKTHKNNPMIHPYAMYDSFRRTRVTGCNWKKEVDWVLTDWDGTTGERMGRKRRRGSSIWGIVCWKAWLSYCWTTPICRSLRFNAGRIVASFYTNAFSPSKKESPNPSRRIGSLTSWKGVSRGGSCSCYSFISCYWNAFLVSLLRERLP